MVYETEGDDKLEATKKEHLLLFATYYVSIYELLEFIQELDDIHLLEKLRIINEVVRGIIHRDKYITHLDIRSLCGKTGSKELSSLNMLFSEVLDELYKLFDDEKVKEEIMKSVEAEGIEKNLHISKSEVKRMLDEAIDNIEFRGFIKKTQTSFKIHDMISMLPMCIKDLELEFQDPSSRNEKKKTVRVKKIYYTTNIIAIAFEILNIRSERITVDSIVNLVRKALLYLLRDNEVCKNILIMNLGISEEIAIAICKYIKRANNENLSRFKSFYNYLIKEVTPIITLSKDSLIESSKRILLKTLIRKISGRSTSEKTIEEPTLHVVYPVSDSISISDFPNVISRCVTSKYIFMLHSTSAYLIEEFLLLINTLRKEANKFINLLTEKDNKIVNKLTEFLVTLLRLYIHLKNSADLLDFYLERYKSIIKAGEHQKYTNKPLMPKPSYYTFYTDTLEAPPFYASVCESLLNIEYAYMEKEDGSRYNNENDYGYKKCVQLKNAYLSMISDLEPVITHIRDVINNMYENIALKRMEFQILMAVLVSAMSIITTLLLHVL